MLSSLWGPLSGYKLAYTTPVMQERAGLDHPVLGGVFEKTILRSPVVLNFTEYVNLGIELEVGVTLGKDLPASGRAVHPGRGGGCGCRGGDGL